MLANKMLKIRIIIHVAVLKCIKMFFFINLIKIILEDHFGKIRRYILSFKLDDQHFFSWKSEDHLISTQIPLHLVLYVFNKEKLEINYDAIHLYERQIFELKYSSKF